MVASFTGLLQSDNVGVLQHILSFLDAPALLREETSRSVREVLEKLQSGKVGILQHILSFLDAPALLRCEETCRSLRDVIADDQVWQFCPNFFRHDPRISTDRMGACISYCSTGRWTTQKSTALQFFDEDLTVDEWMHMLTRLMDSFHEAHRFSLRGDTLGALLELLQDVVTRDLVFSVMFSNHSSAEERYPALTNLDMIHFDIATNWPGFMDGLVPLRGEFLVEYARNTSHGLRRLQEPHLVPTAEILVRNLLQHASGTKVIRRLAYLAGVIKLDHDVYERTWRKIVYMIVNLLYPVCTSLAQDEHNLATSLHDKKYLRTGVTIDMVPPLSHRFDIDGVAEFHHTPVPRQIFSQAQTLQLPFTKVYGDIWLASGGRTVEEEMADAQELYEEGEDDEETRVWYPEKGAEIDEGWEVEMEDVEESQVLEMWEEELQLPLDLVETKNGDEEMEDGVDALSHSFEEQVGLD